MTNLDIVPDKNFVNLTRGRPDAPILVVCDSPGPSASAAGKVMTDREWNLLVKTLQEAGFTDPDQFQFICPCGTIPAQFFNSESKKTKWVQAHSDMFREMLAQRKYEMVIPLGVTAAKQVFQRAVKITNIRGIIAELDGKVVLPVFQPGYVDRVPHLGPVLTSDLRLAHKIAANNYKTNISNDVKTDYKYVTDIQFLLDNRPERIAIDTEGTGLEWIRGHYPFLLQISYREGESLCVPLCRVFWPEYTDEEYAKIMAQVKELLEDDSVKKVLHNSKFDMHMLRNIGINVRGVDHDTILLAYVVDENMQSKSLDDCVIRWVPEMAGYSNELQTQYNKSRMMDIPRDILLRYSGGDSDATLRLFNKLLPLAQEDARHYKRYTHVLMPANILLANIVERTGMKVNLEYLSDMQSMFAQQLEETHKQALKLIPRRVRQRWIQKGRFSLNQLAFVRDAIFSKDGLALTPLKFTKSTERGARDEQVASTSYKDHLQLLTIQDTSGFILKYGEYTKLKKLYTTMINGFVEKYVSKDGYIHPSYALHRTNTGRLSSEKPNGQNIPKHGPLAKTYTAMLDAPTGYVILDADLSQAELRIAGESADDPVIKKAYRDGEDLHTYTAATTMDWTLERFKAQPKDVQKPLRQKAKPVNFGLIYDMSAPTLQLYAKLNYGVDMTDVEARRLHEKFFKTYPKMKSWQMRQKELARKQKFVRSLHGFKRRLPTIDSPDRGVASLAERQAINAPVQLLASDINIIGAIRFQRDCNPNECKIIQLVHDNIKCFVKSELVEHYAKALKWYMENPPLEKWFGLHMETPIVAEVGWGRNQAEIIDVPDLPAEPFSWYDDTLDDYMPLDVLGDYLY